MNKRKFEQDPECLTQFCLLDDYDVMGAIKAWAGHPDRVLSTLSKMLINRELFKVVLSNEPFDKEIETVLKQKVTQAWGFTEEELDYFVFSDDATLRAYNMTDEKINILFKDGTFKDISSIDNALISQTLAIPIKKFYICHPKI
ncbi:hypothetical protein MKQ68_24790 [Chitinophaga horti]|uniref:Uncharacterized protein n=1 Tax=Chitinophaga horti TaxID=2920382 RepID=A0ABY6J0Z3_9BACT|nr:hypothetical protein [Chitinophaga horti]UYQ93305.1 hypothetical protein MKQ68_24790 [Chitinophaga horti]